MHRRTPVGGGQAGIGFLFGDLPVGFQRRFPFSIFLLRRAVQRSRAGVDQVNNAVLSPVSELLAGNAFNRLRRPVGTHIGEDLRGAGHQVPKEHCHAVQTVIFGRHHVRLANAIPVERAVKQRLCGIAVGIMIGPVTLPLETGSYRVIAQRLLHAAHLSKFRVALHHVAYTHRHQQAFPQDRCILLLVAAILLRIFIFAEAEMCFRPAQCQFKLLFIVDLMIDTTAQLGHIYRLHLHTKP